MSRRIKIGKIALRYGFTLIVVGIAFYYLIQEFDIQSAFDTLRRADPLLFAAAMLAFYVSFPLRTERWRWFLSAIDVEAGRLSANLILLVGYYLNTLVPAKLGDIYRSYLAAGRYDDRVSSIAGTIAAERIIDLCLLAVGLVFALPIVLTRRTEFVSRVTTWAVVLLVVVGVGTVALLRFDVIPLPERMNSAVTSFRRGLRAASGRSLGDRVSIMALSVSVWSTNIIRTALVAAALGINLSLAEITLLALLVAFLSGLPWVPAGIGLVEVISTSVLLSLGLSAESALALILLDRTITVVTLVLLGTPIYVLVLHFDQSKLSGTVVADEKTQ
ncbi:hypothetical protein SAMN04488065_2900 [Haloplanus vescus]|uniref:Lysylphosphatidylglycerol synthase TM region n=1 Tax=Haloplanus vescus TaxID=555874 RepID=A0A1H4AR02_9EURY|nr:lysylphosphatidylglycerol synthase transmembrane domain-containing protein [Haloplanus vescus]SEA38218.1 hypothetical protein SAMN04488065_2900 [Haloplanus vescus]